MKTKENLDSSKATIVHTIIPAGFIRRKRVRLPSVKSPASHAYNLIIQRVGNCLKREDLYVVPDENMVDGELHLRQILCPSCRFRLETAESNCLDCFLSKP